MRNSLFMGQATRFLKEEAQTEIFLKATGGSLNKKTMRDREFVNRFCAFQIIKVDKYRGDMDDFLADCLRSMNKMEKAELSRLSAEFHGGLANNFRLFDKQAFRKHESGQERRGVLNASFWDVMSTGLSHYAEDQVDACAAHLRRAVYRLLADEEFNIAITYGPNDARKVRRRFKMAKEMFEEASRCSHGLTCGIFKCFETLKLSLCPLTLLSGANASGKSSVMQALALLHQTMREHEWSSRLMLNGSTVRLGAVG